MVGDGVRMRTGQVIAGAQEKLAAIRSTRKRRLVIVAVLAILIVAPSVGGKKSLVKIFQMSKTRTELQQEIVRLRQVNEELAQEIRAFANNPDQVEAIAREDLGLVKPGEIVYQFGPPRPTTAPSAPSR
jgi:cell division protein FtsB